MDDLDAKARELREQVHAVVLQQRAIEASTVADPKVDLSRQELLAIEVLGDAGDQIMRALAQGLFLAVNTVTSLVDNLEQKKLVRRIRDAKDRRLVWVHLTAEGERVYEAILDERLRLCRSLLQALGDEEQETYLRLMRKIADAARAYVAGEPGAGAPVAHPSRTTAATQGQDIEAVS